MVTLNQARAERAFKDVTAVSTWAKPQQDKYATIVLGMPALLRSAGLSQALHFVFSRSKSKEDIAPAQFLKHLASQLGRVDATIKDGETLLAAVRGAPLTDYLRLSQETLACVNWYRRFVQGVLDADPSALASEVGDS